MPRPPHIPGGFWRCRVVVPLHLADVARQVDALFTVGPQNPPG